MADNVPGMLQQIDKNVECSASEADDFTVPFHQPARARDAERSEGNDPVILYVVWHRHLLEPGPALSYLWGAQYVPQELDQLKSVVMQGVSLRENPVFWGFHEISGKHEILGC